jgi:type VI protein secretion system component Hcp
MADTFLTLMKAGDQLIEGESLDEAIPRSHHGAIEIRDWSWKIQNMTTYLEESSGGAAPTTGTSKLDIYNITLQKYCDFASANLLRYCLLGDIIPKAEIVCRKNFGEYKHEYLVIELTKVKIHHVELKGMDTGQVVNEEVQLQFGQFEVHYTQQLNEGQAGRAISLGWDVENDKELGNSDG